MILKKHSLQLDELLLLKLKCSVSGCKKTACAFLKTKPYCSEHWDNEKSKIKMGHGGKR